MSDDNDLLGHIWVEVKDLEGFIKTYPEYKSYIFPDMDKLFFCNKCSCYKRIIFGIVISESIFYPNSSQFGGGKLYDLTCEEVQIKILLE